MNSNNYLYANTYLMQYNKIVNNMAYEMLSIVPTQNITIDFIKCMIPHHMAAIYMCNNFLNYSKYPPLVEIIKKIINQQNEGIRNMEEILRTTPKYKNPKKQVQRYLSKYYEIVNNMVWMMRHSLKSNNIELDFINEMIPHHEGAIAMCKNLLQYPTDPRLISVANEIINEQTKGIKELKEIRKNINKENYS